MAIAFLLAGAATAYWAGIDHHRAPYSADAVNAHVEVQLVDRANAEAAIDRLAGPDRLSAVISGSAVARQVVIGQLDFNVPDNAPHDGQYALFVIDNDDHRVVPEIWGVGPNGTNVASGWDGRYSNAADDYSWLEPIADIADDDGTVSDPGAAVAFQPDTASPVIFAANLRPNSLPISNPAEQLTIALVFFDDNGHVYWADRLPM